VPGHQPQVGVVVVTYSPGDTLDGFLDTLEKATTRPFTVVLADNGSTDGAPERAAGRPGVELFRTGGNLGYGRAANLGLPRVPGDWVVVANPDLRWEPGALDTLLDAVERWPRAGVLGPEILTPDGELYPSARELPSLGRGIGHALCGWWWPSNPWTASYRRERGEPAERVAGWLSGSCLLVRREAFDAVGGFDPAYFMYFEGRLAERVRADVGRHPRGRRVDPVQPAGDGGRAPRQRVAVSVPALHRGALGPGPAGAAGRADGPGGAGPAGAGGGGGR